MIQLTDEIIDQSADRPIDQSNSKIISQSITNLSIRFELISYTSMIN
jgi:hypothetical protein